jgi:YidC/Oxa1 family membrane protein insertase
MGLLYHLFLFQPLVNALVFLYNTIALNDLGVSIVILTFAIRLLFFPLFQKVLRQQTILQKLKPEIEKIEKEHKGNLEKKGQAQLALYKENKVNPFSMFFILFLQIMILIPLFQIFHNAPNSINAKDIYFFIVTPATFNHSFLGLIDLQSQSIILIIIASLLQGLQSYLSLAVQKNTTSTNRQMAIIAPLIIVAVLWTSPSAVWLYLLASNLFSLIQQGIINRELTAQK